MWVGDGREGGVAVPRTPIREREQFILSRDRDISQYKRMPIAPLSAVYE